MIIPIDAEKTFDKIQHSLMILRKVRAISFAMESERIPRNKFNQERKNCTLKTIKHYKRNEIIYINGKVSY